MWQTHHQMNVANLPSASELQVPGIVPSSREFQTILLNNLASNQAVILQAMVASQGAKVGLSCTFFSVSDGQKMYIGLKPLEILLEFSNFPDAKIRFLAD